MGKAKIRRARLSPQPPRVVLFLNDFSLFRSLEQARREPEAKYVPQLFLGLLLRTRRSAIGQFFSVSLVTAPEVLAEVNSSQSPRF